MRELLARHGIAVQGRRLRCSSPDHLDKRPSAWLFADDRVRCFSCGFHGDVIDVARALGETVELRSSRQVMVPQVERRPGKLARSFARAVAARPEFAFEWEATKQLAQLPPYWARVEVAHNFDYLRARGDVDVMLQGAYLVRGVAFMRFCTAKTAGNPASVAYAVRRLLNEVGA